MQFSPSPEVIFKCAALMLLAELNAEGLELAAMGKPCFPREAAVVAKELEGSTARYPGLVPLREMLAR